MDWAAAKFGGLQNIVSADVHLDEAQDHLHILLVPLFDGKLRGSAALGHRKKLSSLHESFFLEVSSKYGLTRSLRLTRLDQTYLANSVINHLTGDPARHSAAWGAIKYSIERNPLVYASLLGITPVNQQTGRKPRTMCQIFTSKGKGKKYEPS